MSSPGFKDVLLKEIEYQKEMRKRMGDDHPEFDNGIMWQIRMERLALLQQLLTFEATEPQHSITDSIDVPESFASAKAEKQ